MNHITFDTLNNNHNKNGTEKIHANEKKCETDAIGKHQEKYDYALHIVYHMIE